MIIDERIKELVLLVTQKANQSIELIINDLLFFLILKTISKHKHIVVKGSFVYKKMCNISSLPRDIDIALVRRRSLYNNINYVRDIFEKANFRLLKDIDSVFQSASVNLPFEESDYSARIECLCNTKFDKKGTVNFEVESILTKHLNVLKIKYPIILESFIIKTYSLEKLIAQKVCSLTNALSLDVFTDKDKVFNTLYDLHLLFNSEKVKAIFSNMKRTKKFKKFLFKEFKKDFTLQINYLKYYKHYDQIFNKSIYSFLDVDVNVLRYIEYLKDQCDTELILQNSKNALILISSIVKEGRILRYMKKKGQKKYDKRDC
ncbi:MAG: nucleotidyl transferase AbiEii/AbiGii toxin family protein [Firmicutes bacterium]|nr:nucleotidyl transferase AbiEii/AbiGii toxin family protein [Bacillota bacterium]